MLTTNKIRKAVLPAAGLGTRFLPATKVLPKEMLPVMDKPLLQYAVEEAVASGIEEIILVTRPGKQIIFDHFDGDGEVVRLLKKRGRQQEAEALCRLGRLVKLISVEQSEPLGLGHAVGCARQLVRDEPFAVILPDDIIDAPIPCTQQLLEVHAWSRASVIATQEVQGVTLERGGVLAVEPVEDSRWQGRLFRVTDMVEKPSHTAAPSHYGVIGRYILYPEIFSFINATPPGRNGEIQLTDALRLFAKQRPLFAFAFHGDHMDAGNKFGFLCATVRYGLKHREVGLRFRDYLKSLKFDS